LHSKTPLNISHILPGYKISNFTAINHPEGNFGYLITEFGGAVIDAKEDDFAVTELKGLKVLFFKLLIYKY
jgi:hypothetical protein